jgi:hypothetical protein
MRSWDGATFQPDLGGWRVGVLHARSMSSEKMSNESHAQLFSTASQRLDDIETQKGDLVI